MASLEPLGSIFDEDPCLFRTTRFCPSARSAASAHCAAKFSADSATILAFDQFLVTGAFAVTYVLVK